MGNSNSIVTKNILTTMKRIILYIIKYNITNINDLDYNNGDIYTCDIVKINNKQTNVIFFDNIVFTINNIDLNLVADNLDLVHVEHWIGKHIRAYLYKVCYAYGDIINKTYSITCTYVVFHNKRDSIGTITYSDIDINSSITHLESMIKTTKMGDNIVLTGIQNLLNINVDDDFIKYIGINVLNDKPKSSNNIEHEYILAATIKHVYDIEKIAICNIIKAKYE